VHEVANGDWHSFGARQDRTVDTENLGKSKFLNLLFKPPGSAMESRFRRFLHDPVKILHGADIRPGQVVLEVGSGTGFFTMDAARIIGDQGRLIAMDPLTTYVERLNKKVNTAGLRNVQVVRRDALDTGLDDTSIDRALLFGVLPFPSLPLNRLLPEMHRVLKPNGNLAVWMFPIAGWVPSSIRLSALFTFTHKRNGVYNYRRSQNES
jgi:demethylmenaquinone methyltransferase/2-methoxy-6-polyprenyl-1,4-benzoquinol methylase